MDETGQNVQIFEEVLFFKLRATTTRTKTEKQTINPTYFVLLDVGGWRKEVGTKLKKVE